IIESRDAIFNENRFSLVPRPSLRIPNETGDIGGLVVPEEVTEEVVQQPEPELKKSKKNGTSKNFRPEFHLYLIEGTRDEVSDQHSYCFNVEDDLKKFDEAMKSQYVAFWKEAINDEITSSWATTLGCWLIYLQVANLLVEWIFKRKLKVDGTIEMFKARLVIQGFKQNSGIDYFDTYAPVARISTIRLMIAMASIHNLIIHQMDAKIAFLNDDLDEEVDLTKEFLSSRFSMKVTGEADVNLGIKIKHESNGIAISQSHYIEKVLKKFNYFDCTPVSTPMDTSEKLMPNNGQVVSQLEYSGAIGCLMYAMTCIRHDIAFVVGKLSRLTYTGYPSVLEGYTDASWINNTKDNSSTSGWVFLLAAAGKETKWLRNLILEIPLWSKPITPISISCDSAATLANAYSQMYNGKSRHLGVRHNMIYELITNGVISIEFVRSQQNLADHLTKGLARDLLIKSAEGI
ncbi:zinc finger, CCHC-type containing protein, partial [Tanacetum coccineum]